MGKKEGRIVVEKGTQAYEPPAGLRKGCGLCPAGCRTFCIRGRLVSNDIVEGEMDDFKLVPGQTDHGSFRRQKAEQVARKTVGTN